MRLPGSILAGLCAMAVGLALASCEREQRQFRSAPPAAERANTVTLSELQSGAQAPVMHVKNQYEESAYAISEGKRLYEWFNCVGCHFHGGGGIGPALMDDVWIYGSAPENVYATIVEGRPNGMPSFRGKIPDDQVWQIVAYVRSMSGLVSKGAAPARSEHMNAKPPEQSEQAQQPKHAGEPKPSEQSQ
jgi:cytochrome c oxidase cbb3-type subunit III